MGTQHPDPLRLTGNAELRRLLEDAIDALPDVRIMFVLRAVEGMSVDETADPLSIRPETVKTRFYRARHRLQETLGRRGLRSHRDHGPRPPSPLVGRGTGSCRAARSEPCAGSPEPHGAG
jgi:hypothetical protein